MAEDSHGTVGQVKRVVNVTVSTGSRWAARSKARLAKPFDEAGLAGMGHADRVDPAPELVRLACHGTEKSFDFFTAFYN